MLLAVIIGFPVIGGHRQRLCFPLKLIPPLDDVLFNFNYARGGS